MLHFPEAHFIYVGLPFHVDLVWLWTTNQGSGLYTEITRSPSWQKGTRPLWFPGWKRRRGFGPNPRTEDDEIVFLPLRYGPRSVVSLPVSLFLASSLMKGLPLSKTGEQVRTKEYMGEDPPLLLLYQFLCFTVKLRPFCFRSLLSGYRLVLEY